MSSVTKVPLEIRAEAAAWLARLRADDKSVADERAFRAWLAEDHSHVAAFEAVTEAWEAAGALRTEFVRRRSASPFVTRRRAVLAGVSALAVTGICFALRQRAFAGVYETVIGEQKHVVLMDGTQVFLDTDTRIHTSIGDEARIVNLERGRCDFHVTDDHNCPFMVNADARRIVSGRSDFDVQWEGEVVTAVVLQGSVAVSGGQGLPQDPCVLRAGERLVATRAGGQVDKPNLARILAWQTGQAVFENDSLADAVREMNRYSVVKLEADDHVVAQMRISGVYHVGDNVAFARSVAALLPVSLHIAPDQIRFVVDSTRAKRA